MPAVTIENISYNVQVIRLSILDMFISYLLRVYTAPVFVGLNFTDDLVIIYVVHYIDMTYCFQNWQG